LPRSDRAGEQEAPRADETVKRPLTSESFSWLCEADDSERVLKIRLRNSIDAEKSLYRLMRFDAEAKMALVQAAAGR
jgi:hypothetical protein